MSSLKCLTSRPPDVGTRMKGLVKIVDAIVAKLCWRPFSLIQKSLNDYEKARDQGLLRTLDYDCVKSMVREDGGERVRIVQSGGNFSAVVDVLTSEGPCSCWTPDRMLGAGFIYDSAEAAESEAASTVSWLKPRIEGLA